MIYYYADGKQLANGTKPWKTKRLVRRALERGQQVRAEETLAGRTVRFWTVTSGEVA
jgi:hypothetical protein